MRKQTGEKRIKTFDPKILIDTIEINKYCLVEKVDTIIRVEVAKRFQKCYNLARKTPYANEQVCLQY